MTTTEGNVKADWDVPARGPIVGSILAFAGWLVFILAYALFWSNNFSFFQDAIVALVSFLVMGLLIGALWMIYYTPSGRLRARKPIFHSDLPSGRNKDVMTIGERGGELVSIAAAILITAFFVYHQVASTGFFTSAFGVPEAFLFYGVAIFGMIVSTLHAITGNRKTVRPVELASNVFFLITAVALFYIFPFNFAHLSNALPVSIRFLLSWITNDIGRILLAFGVLGASVATIVTTIKLTGDRKLFSERNESRNDDSAVATLPSEL